MRQEEERGGYMLLQCTDALPYCFELCTAAQGADHVVTATLGREGDCMGGGGRAGNPLIDLI